MSAECLSEAGKLHAEIFVPIFDEVLFTEHPGLRVLLPILNKTESWRMDLFNACCHVDEERSQACKTFQNKLDLAIA